MERMEDEQVEEEEDILLVKDQEEPLLNIEEEEELIFFVFFSCVYFLLLFLLTIYHQSSIIITIVIILNPQCPRLVLVKRIIHGDSPRKLHPLSMALPAVSVLSIRAMDTFILPPPAMLLLCMDLLIKASIASDAFKLQQRSFSSSNHFLLWLNS